MSEIILPKEKVKATQVNPRRLVLYAPPKMGKTTLVSMLDNCLVLDLENGSDFVDAIKLKASNVDEIRQIMDKIDEAGKPYDYIAIDTVTKLEEMVLPLALKLYKNTPMGKNFKGDDVRKLPNGAGYLYLREAFSKVISRIEKSASKGILLIGHLKEKMLGKEGKEVNAKDINLTGQNKNIVCADADAIGYLYRDKNKTILNFSSSEEVLCGSRSAHLKGKSIVLGEEVDGNLVSHWDEVYLTNQ